VGKRVPTLGGINFGTNGKIVAPAGMDYVANHLSDKNNRLSVIQYAVVIFWFTLSSHRRLSDQILSKYFKNQ
jgi:hypothetical protein